MAKVDVIVPCYRYGHYLPACLDSILRQSVRDLRVLIIDDASPDGSAEAASRLCRGEPRVAVVLHAENRGHIATYNEGLAWASADYLLLLSADDLLAAGALERAVTIMDSHPEVVLTYGRCLDRVDHQPLPEPHADGNPSWSLRDGEDFIRATCASGLNLVPTPTAILRTAVQKKIGGYRPELPHSGDMEMWLRLAANGAVASIDAVQAVRRRHATSMSTAYYSDVVADYLQRKAAFDSFFSGHADRLPDSRSLQWQADRVLAERAFWTAIGQLCRGEIEKGRRLLRFATGICPSLRFWPPFGQLVRTDQPRLRISSALGALLTIALRRDAAS